MRNYEIFVIFDAKTEDSQVSEWINKITEDVKIAQGEIVGIDNWGKRQFAYEVDHRTEGVYLLFSVRSEPNSLDELDQKLRFADDVVRHKIIRVPDIAFSKISQN
jgi:small subunit ribosomal protein S6